MASSPFIQCLLLFAFLSFSNAQIELPSSATQPASIVFDLERDASTLQYMIKLDQGTPRTVANLVLDMGGVVTWLRCNKASSSYQLVDCRTPQCLLGSRPITTTCGDNNSACNMVTVNPVTRAAGNSELISDLVTVVPNPDSDGIPPVSPSRFRFGCPTTSNIFSGLAKGSTGVASIGRTSVISLVNQFSVQLKFSRIFALELYNSSGMIYFGGGPYIHSDFSSGGIKDRVLEYTPLLINPVRTAGYYVDLKSIQVYGKAVPIDEKLLSINQETGFGGTEINILAPYTTLETAIYKAFIKVHTEWAKSKNIAMAASVAPFTACYKSSTIPPEFESGLPVVPPSVAFNFPRSQWRVVWWDLVQVKDDVKCVAFVDGGSKPTSSIVIGAHQIGFGEFDISRSRFGFQQPNFML
ncbi:hypothetical protein MKW98_010117 [Papaver atlanticum]|uniref:Peptidase A1 domain-containing protein n=1 Tax=Papaver atlanticum TaxID=357466 RepID=A0AAD4RXU5_9MAGN|nr:hypothetical protein MKW98_010117 [Papaver atlanticum]